MALRPSLLPFIRFSLSIVIVADGRAVLAKIAKADN